MIKETAEISEHMVKVFRFVADRYGWATAKQIAAGSGVSGRTARAHCRHLVQQGIFDQAEVFPGHRYRVSETAEKRNKAYLLRLREAESVFGDEK